MTKFIRMLKQRFTEYFKYPWLMHEDDVYPKLNVQIILQTEYIALSLYGIGIHQSIKNVGLRQNELDLSETQLGSFLFLQEAFIHRNNDNDNDLETLKLQGRYLGIIPSLPSLLSHWRHVHQSHVKSFLLTWDQD